MKYILGVLILISILVISGCELTQPQNAPRGKVSDGEDSLQLPIPEEPINPSGVSITSVSSTTLRNNGEYIISGGNFGKKKPVAPLKWDNFENGIQGANLSNEWYLFSHTYGYPGYSHPKYTNEKTRGKGNIAVLQEYLNSINPNQTMNGFGLQNISTDELFVSYHEYREMDSLGVNFKPFGAHSTYLQPPQMRYGAYGFDQEDYIEHKMLANCNLSYAQPIWGEFDISPGWNKRDYYINVGDIDTPNGELLTWKEGKEDGNIENFTLRLSECEDPYYDGTGILEEFLINYYYRKSHYPEENQTAQFDARFFVDDLYVDTTIARLEICRASTWAEKESSGSHCEMQIPQKTWNLNTIEFKANQGAFNDGEIVYLYVVTTDGQVNARGYPLKFQTKIIGDEGPRPAIA